MSEEDQLVEIIQNLRRAYEEAIEPYLERLRKIRAMQLPKPILLTREQAKEWGVVIENLIKEDF